MVSERIRSASRSSTCLQRLGGEVLVVHGHVVGGVGVGAAAVRLEHLVELLRPVLLRAVEHHVLEEVADAGDARALVARAHLEEGVEAHHRRVVVGHDADPEAVGERGFVHAGRGHGSFCIGHGEGPAYRRLAAFDRLRAPGAHGGEDEAAPDARRPTPARWQLQEAPGAACGAAEPADGRPGLSRSQSPALREPRPRAARACATRSSSSAMPGRAAAGLGSDRHGARVHHSPLRCHGGPSRKKTDSGSPAAHPGPPCQHPYAYAANPPPPPAALPLSVVHGGAPEPAPPSPEAAAGGGAGRARRRRAGPPADDASGAAEDGGRARGRSSSTATSGWRTWRWSASTWTTRWPSTTCVGIEQLSFDMTLSPAHHRPRLPGGDRPAPVRPHASSCAAWWWTEAHGNLIKMDRFGQVGRA